MQGVVLAAGEGTRLRPLTEDRPKALVEVAGRPMLSTCFDRLLAAGVEEFVVVVGYLADRILDRYGDDYRGVPVTYAVQDERLGVAHALARAEPHVDGPFLYCHGDNVLHPSTDLGPVVRRLRDGADAVLTVERVSRERATEVGVVVTRDDGGPGAFGAIDYLVEKPNDPPSRLAITGFHGFSPAVFEACRAIDPSDRGEYELPDAITWMVDAGRRVEIVPFQGRRVAVDRPGDRQRAERMLDGTDG